MSKAIFAVLAIVCAAILYSAAKVPALGDG